MTITPMSRNISLTKVYNYFNHRKHPQFMARTMSITQNCWNVFINAIGKIVIMPYNKQNAIMYMNIKTRSKNISLDFCINSRKYFHRLACNEFVNYSLHIRAVHSCMCRDFAEEIPRKQ